LTQPISTCYNKNKRPHTVGHTEREVEMDMDEGKVKEVRANGLLTIWVDEDPREC